MSSIYASGNPVQTAIPQGQLSALVGTPYSSYEDSINIYTFSTEYTIGKWDFNGEFSRLDGISHTTLGNLVKNKITGINLQSWYLSATYRVNNWLALGTYFNPTVSDYQDQSGSKASIATGLPRSAFYQDDTALCARIDLSRNWIFKLEGHYMNGTSLEYNETGENPNNSAARDPQWFMLVAKTSWSF